MSDVPNRQSPLTAREGRDVSSGGGSVATSRRALLTGAAAIPVVMTLPTNASAEAFGSTLRCLVNQTDQPDMYFCEDASSPWQTEPVQCMYVELPNGDDPCTLVDFPSGCIDCTGRQWYFLDQTRCVSEDYVSGAKHQLVGYGQASGYVTVDLQGNYCGCDPITRSQGALCVYGSCYVSIMGIG